MEEYKRNFMDNMDDIEKFLNLEYHNFKFNYNQISLYIDNYELSNLINEYVICGIKEYHSNNQRLIKEICSKLDTLISNLKPGIDILRSTKSAKRYGDHSAHCDMTFVVSQCLHVNNLLGKEKLIPRDMYNYFDDCRANLMFVTRFTLKDCNAALKYTELVEKYSCNKDIPSVIEYLIYLKDLYYSYSDDNPSNIYRQSFIILMSTFDATISELYLKFFNKIKSSTLAFNIAELYEACSSIFIRNNKNIFPDVIELIRRRNTHLHHKGKVDTRYLQPKFPNEKGKYEFTNLYKLAEDDLAHITEEYLCNAMILLESVIEKITKQIVD